MSQVNIQQVHRYNAEIVEGLKGRSHCDRNPLPDVSGKAELQEILYHSPQEYGYDTATWTGASVRNYIEKRYGVEYKKAQIYNILHSADFSFQKGKGYFPEAEGREERVEAVKKLQSAEKNSVSVFEDEV